MSQLPDCETLLLHPHQGVLHITLSRPEYRNAMSLQMLGELRSVFRAASADEQIRVIVLAGAGGHFCAGADLKDMAQARQQGASACAGVNRAFGSLLGDAQNLPQVLVVALEGAVLGGGVGLACVSDIAIAHRHAQFGLPETSLGLLPAQIAPFLVSRIGLAQTRRLALTAGRFDGEQAARLGLVHFVERDSQAMAERLGEVLDQVLRCAPKANAATKALLLATENTPLAQLLDRAAQEFGVAVSSIDGVEGTLAFLQKRDPAWVRQR